MNSELSELGKSVTLFCAELGKNPLLVQGAGGNVSWKEGHTLWVKASGAWLADATTRDIFVPVDLAALRASIDKENFSAVPELQVASELKPSIETILHALMPHTVVVHVHAVDVLALLVRDTVHQDLESRIGDALNWVCVDYHKPGAQLAVSIHAALVGHTDANVVFMKNHGLVIGGASVDDIRNGLTTITARLAETSVATPAAHAAVAEHPDYIAVPDGAVQALAQNHSLFQRLRTDWALYPDHVVFLGAAAHVYESWDAFRHTRSNASPLPELIFIQHCGVFVLPSFSKAKTAQLRCYYDVMLRQGLDNVLHVMNHQQIDEVLNWDSEKYRQRLEK